MKLSDAIDRFLKSCRADGLSPKTVEYYGQCLNPLRIFLAALVKRCAYSVLKLISWASMDVKVGVHIPREEKSCLMIACFFCQPPSSSSLSFFKA